jgi:hypothetical protein
MPRIATVILRWRSEGCDGVAGATTLIRLDHFLAQAVASPNAFAMVLVALTCAFPSCGQAIVTGEDS